MAVTIDHDDARKKLEIAWGKVEDAKVAAKHSTLQMIHELMKSTTGAVTFKYILVTGLLAKFSNPKAHSRAIQASSKLKEAYDARSLCHEVVVPFEQSKGNLFGVSNEPFVNKPARHPEHDKNNPQLKYKHLATLTHDVLEAANGARPKEIEAMLVSTLRVGKEIAASLVIPSVDVDTNLLHVLRFVREFMKESDGGARLVALTGAFVTLLSEEYTVKVYPPNASDKYAKTSGDIEIFSDEGILSGYECKDRPITLEDVHHGIKKARDRGITEYCFVFADGLATGQESQIHAEVITAQAELDVSLIDFNSAVSFWSAILNPERRGTFGETVATLLRDSINRPATANTAAELWNSLK